MNEHQTWKDCAIVAAHVLTLNAEQIATNGPVTPPLAGPQPAAGLAGRDNIARARRLYANMKADGWHVTREGTALAESITRLDAILSALDEEE